ncbi:MAG: hypothetical protein RI947_71 [Candidatus Parcubacteria bacterium]|jgi:pyruvate formate lyase activating enzyme
MLNIHSIETFGTHEGPGIRLVVFLQGCRLRCLYCHNPDTWALNAGKPTTIDKILEQLDKQKPYIQKKGGITVSGGEPLIQRKALIELFTRVQKLGYHTTLDTNGSILDEDTKALLNVTDLVLLDVKHINPEMHFKLTQSTNNIVLQFAEYCEQNNKKMWLRYVLVPGWTDQEMYLNEWGKKFRSYKNVERVEILPYHTLGVYKHKALGNEYKLNGISPPSHQQVSAAQSIFQQYFNHVFIR